MKYESSGCLQPLLSPETETVAYIRTRSSPAAILDNLCNLIINFDLITVCS